MQFDYQTKSISIKIHIFNFYKMRDDKGKSEVPLLQINTIPSADVAEGRLRVIYESSNR